ncbi:hypothetical protein BT93_L3045 [Corymbia citriodora subsp. variegata]|uniref:Dynein light chain n=1 Tax=Corymbia citriodora subsp. variegata TaxID=360336 RepID=A0A8T0CNG6_CORYI|nr:hypothetical protein BT93_L3045 [Corymbia citriodora subsp. variegata]
MEKKQGRLSEKEKQVAQVDRIHRPNKDERHDKPPKEEVLRLAAVAVSFNIRLKSSDMPVHMQEHALRCTRSFLDSSPNLPPNNTHLARALKKVSRERRDSERKERDFVPLLDDKLRQKFQRFMCFV